NHAFSWQRLRNTLKKRLFRYIHQLLSEHSAAPDRDGARGIPDKFVVIYPDIEADYVTKLQFSWPSQPMNDLFVHGNANIAREFPVPVVPGVAIPQKCAFCAMLFYARG